MDEKEIIAQLESFNPLTDTGRALKFLIRYVAEHNHQSDAVDMEILERVRRVAEAIDHRDELDRRTKARHTDVLRLVRNVAAKVVGDMDKMLK